MWDVKLTLLVTLGGLVRGRFYLNYVGCKAIFSTSSDFAGSWFYLNYVGCKARAKDFFDNSLRRFYLNYVGCKEKKGGGVRKGGCGFYLNYVGCKVGSRRDKGGGRGHVLSELCGM